MRERSQSSRPPASRRGSTARTGLIIAAALALASGGTIAYFALSSPKRTEAARDIPAEAPPTAAMRGSGAPQPGRPAVTIGQGGKGLSFEIASKSDPSRLAGTITTKTLDPLEANRYAAEKPESFVFLRDGRTIHVKADSGRLYIPQSTPNQPESGTLTGNVEIALYERAARAIDPARDQPIATLTTSTLSFDLTTWEFVAPDDVRIVGQSMSYDGKGLRLLLNQTQERVELLTFASSRELRVHNTSSAERTAAKPAQAKPVPVTPAPESAAPTAPAVATTSPAPAPAAEHARAAAETFYHLVLTRTVRVTQDDRSVDADALDLWAHTVGGQLPPNAIASVTRTTAKKTETAPAHPSASVSTPAQSTTGQTAAPSPQAAPITAVESDVVITWAGPLELRPLDARPVELALEDVALRFTANDPLGVRFADSRRAGSPITGAASRIEYGATSRNVALAGIGAEGVQLDLGNSGQLRCESLALDLNAGVATVAGPGAVSGVIGPGFDGSQGAEASLPDRLVRWTRGAEFRFLVSDAGLSGSLQSAALFGDVEGHDRGATLQGQSLAATFFPEPDKTGPVSRLIVRGDTRAEDGRGGSITCERFDVGFRRRADAPAPSDPSTVTATGAALAMRPDATLMADMIEANLERDAEGRTVVSDMLASDGAYFERSDGLWARAPEIRASATRRTVVIAGENAELGKGPSSVHGEDIEVDGNTRTVSVFGAGRFRHSGKDAAGRALDASATWTRSMTFDDRSGVLEARGESHAETYSAETLTQRLLDAGAVRLELTPGGTDNPLDVAKAEPAKPDAGKPDAASARHVLRAEVIGASQDIEGGGAATVISRTYEPEPTVPDGRRLVEELRLEGDHIVADDVKGTLQVPGRGVLRVVDVRTSPAGEKPASPGADLSARGAARFEWAGSLLLSRDEGTATMRERVKMRHLPVDGGAMTELEGEEIVAHIADLSTDGKQGARGRLVRASASGAVWARLDKKELTADRLEYLTAERLIRAGANTGNDVTLFDPTQPSPLKAKLLEWDLARDRVEVKAPGTIVIPR